MADIRGNLFWVALVLAGGGGGGLVASTLVASKAYQQSHDDINKREQSLAVTGSARKRITSDLSVWHISINSDARDLKDAYKQLKEGFDKVQSFLVQKGFKPSEIANGSIDTEKHYTKTDKGQDTREIEQYSLSRSIVVTTDRFEPVLAASSEVTELLKDGVQVVSSAPEFYYTKLGELKIQMLGEASKDARNRADQIANNSGCKVSDVRNARMGVLQITRPNSTEVTGSGVNDSTSIEKDVMAVVSLTFGLSN